MSSTTSRQAPGRSSRTATPAAIAQGHPPYASVLDVMIDDVSAPMSRATVTHLGLHPARLRSSQQRIFKDYILSPQAYSLADHLNV